MRIRNGKILYLGSVNSLMRIRDGKILDLGWKNFYAGSGIFLTLKIKPERNRSFFIIGSKRFHTPRLRIKQNRTFYNRF
jgi:hypothetical protein